ncbi:UDP-N-acetylglucosamine 4,6-dehydratase [alpha proteobacterium U9-1i]|nr:UDP-N-acetylglucosamine 4,6-dehydratase [alpha proteobacterium U9-1i]
MLVTGAAGSVGAALSERFAELGCSGLILLDHFDHGLLDVAEAISKRHPNLQVVDLLCDVRDRERLASVMERAAPDIVIHCAALKHVHLGERHPGECVLTNLIGVRNAYEAALEAGAERFLLVSTDKAAAPVCVMGATKRLAELYLANVAGDSAMQVKSVRFGNVMASQGSVAPRFAAQIAADGPLQVTHPQMKRFFMSSDEAVGLIVDVLAHDEADTAVASYFMDMGEPMSILELGRKMIAESGRDIAIEFIGLRPGERLEEQLFDEFEMVTESALRGIYRLTPNASSLIGHDDIAELEQMARVMDDAVVRQRVFAKVDGALGRQLSAVG